jgi:hypothetical protein
MTVKTISLLLILCGMSASAQVQIGVPKGRFAQYELIGVVITNTSKRAVSFCVEYGQSSFRDENNSESTPTPVYVQRQTSRGWSTMLIGPDVGSIRGTDMLAPGESRRYPFRLHGPGRMRLILDYWVGENTRTCAAPKGRHTVKSRPFVID